VRRIGSLYGLAGSAGSQQLHGRQRLRNSFDSPAYVAGAGYGSAVGCEQDGRGRTLSDLANETGWRLEALAADPRFSSRADDLRSLGSEVRSEDGVTDSWSGVDLFSAFAPDSIVVLRHRDGFERVLGALAGMSVFFPVAWTWLSFHEASAAYAALLADGGDKGATFLALWTSGFEGGLPGYHRLVPMTLISFALIALAMFFIVVHRWAAASNVHREEKTASAAYAQLVSCLASAHRVLNARRVEDPQQLEALVKASVRRLLRAHEATETSARELKEASAEVSETLGPVLAALETASTRAAASTDLARQAADSLTASVAKTEEGMRRAAQQFSDAIRSHTIDLRDGTKKAIADAAQTAGRAGGEVAQGVIKIADAQQAVADKLAALASATDGLGTETREALADLRSAVGQIESALAVNASAMQGQTSELTGARDAAERMLLQLEQLLMSDSDKQMSI
jgi:hypothetical protein